MRLLLLKYIALIFSIVLVSCQNPYRKNASSAPLNDGHSADMHSVNGKITKDAYQVDSDEYDNFFVMRYGLLYQKLSDVPFNGRIVQVEDGPSGKYVSSDENWRNGKKHGICAKWFSNGSKMFERNYKEGKWHGPVTRWWPNGQRMYVTAYTEGVRNNKEAKWKSDGTPIGESLENTPTAESIETDIEPELSGNVDPLTSDTGIPVIEEPSVISSNPDNFEQAVPAIPVEPQILEVDLPNTTETLLPTPDLETVSPNDSFPAMSETDDIPSELPFLPDNDPSGGLADPSLPTLPGIPEDPSMNQSLPSLPGLPDVSTETDLPTLPGLPEAPAGDESVPPLPGLPDVPVQLDVPESVDALPGLPHLPGFGSGTEDLPGLPPLPSSDDGTDSLPPLPPLP